MTQQLFTVVFILFGCRAESKSCSCVLFFSGQIYSHKYLSYCTHIVVERLEIHGLNLNE